ncbi:MAG: hypothetical protein U9Q15_00380 [Patescibacteria group bacterium]|nr:hypothetical protein [Patescibacteria group bacterium]
MCSIFKQQWSLWKSLFTRQKDEFAAGEFSFGRYMLTNGLIFLAIDVLFSIASVVYQIMLGYETGSAFWISIGVQFAFILGFAVITLLLGYVFIMLLGWVAYQFSGKKAELGSSFPLRKFFGVWGYTEWLLLLVLIVVFLPLGLVVSAQSYLIDIVTVILSVAVAVYAIMVMRHQFSFSILRAIWVFIGGYIVSLLVILLAVIVPVGAISYALYGDEIKQGVQMYEMMEDMDPSYLENLESLNTAASDAK